MTQTSKRSPRFLLLMPDEMRLEIAQIAAANARTVTAEINARLRASLQTTTQPGIAPSYSPTPKATVMHTNDAAHDQSQPITASHHITAIDAAMLKVFKAMPPEKQLALLSLFK